MGRPSTTHALARVLANGRSYVLPEHRVYFLSVPKNACTTLKWALAGIAGEDLAGFRAGLSGVTTEDGAVHNRAQWHRAPQLRDPDPRLVADIGAGEGWFVFALTRDPWSRLFSAWQDKLLLRAPTHFHDDWHAEPWYPRRPSSGAQIVDDFARFVRVLRDDPAHPLLRDAHFRAQAATLRADVVPYTRIYDLTEMAGLRADLQAHLATVGVHEPVRFRASNDMPLRATAAVFADGVRQDVEQLYAADFDAYGQRWDFARLADRPAWSDDAITGAALVAAHRERLGHLIDAARGERDQRRALQARVSELEAEVASGRTPLRAVTRRLRTAIRGRHED